MTVNSAASITNTGLFIVEASSQLTGWENLSFINWGTVDVSAGATLTLTGPGLDHRGTIRLSGGGIDLERGSHQWRGRSAMAGSGTILVRNLSTVTGGGTGASSCPRHPSVISSTARPA